MGIVRVLELTGRLPREALAVFRRYGRPLGPRPDPLQSEHDSQYEPVTLPLDAARSATVRVLALRTTVDVIANDWFVLEAEPDEPLAVPGPLYAAALAALARRGAT